MATWPPPAEERRIRIFFGSEEFMVAIILYLFLVLQKKWL